MTKIIKAPLDEIVEEVMALYHRYDGENKCTLEKTSHELAGDEPMECSCDYTDRLRTAIEKFVVEEDEQNYTAHFLEWRDKYWKRKLKILEWKSRSKHLTTSELYDFYNQAFHHTPKKGGDDEA